MAFPKIITGILSVLFLVGSHCLAAGPIGLGTSQQGTLTYTIGSAIARTLFKTTDIRAAVQPNAGTGVMIPLVANGELDFGFSNTIELNQAIEGNGVFTGRPNPNLRIVARLFPAQVGLLVRTDSDIYKIADLRGAKITTGYQSTPVLHDLIRAMLISGGLSLDDIQQVPVPSLVRGAEAFVSGRADVTFFAAGAGKVNEINSSVGGVRFISLSANDNNVKLMQSVVKQTYVSVLNPRPGLSGILKPTSLLTYEYTMMARADLDSEIVYSVIKAMDNNKDMLTNSSGAFRRMDRDKIMMDLGAEYHAGAIKYFKESGLWNKRIINVELP